ncbi:heme NO-binding domain-containing protein [Magnetococcus sp. PR-3]|uniref:heme NO-binding domain-containing protein n=1 Tax=Magnetococcus sp. PR-3 TaxID=3120355 RepID=UPI002FCDEE28
MHGVIFLALEEYLDERMGEEVWEQVVETAGIPDSDFTPDRMYDAQDWEALLLATAQVMGKERADVLEEFGTYMVPGLMEMGDAMNLLDPRWRTMDYLENGKDLIHAAIRMQIPDFKPPDIRALRLRQGEAAVAYMAKNRMGPLLKGVAQGLGNHFEEELAIWQPESRTGSHFYRINVRLADTEKLRAVDMVREFNTVRTEGGKVQFYNQFMGVPFSNEGTVLDVDDDGVQFLTFRDQLLAMRRNNETFLSLPHMKVGIHAHVKKMDLNKGTVILDRMLLTDGAVGQRQEARVEPPTEIRVQLGSEGKRFQGFLKDISTTGASCKFSRSGLDENYLFLNSKLEFLVPLSAFEDQESLANTNQYFEAEGNILDVIVGKDEVLVRLIFESLSGNAKKLMTLFTAERKQSVIRHMSQIGG